MTLTISLPRDVAQALEDKARRTGQSVADVAAACLVHAARLGLECGTSEQQAEIEARLAAVARIGRYDARKECGLTPLSDEATSRENIYEGRGA